MPKQSRGEDHRLAGTIQRQAEGKPTAQKAPFTLGPPADEKSFGRPPASVQQTKQDASGYQSGSAPQRSLKNHI